MQFILIQIRDYIENMQTNYSNTFEKCSIEHKKKFKPRKLNGDWARLIIKMNIFCILVGNRCQFEW